MTWADIEGWFFHEEAEFLAPFVTGTWCEIGCYKGRSTRVWAESGYPGYAIDWFLGSPEHPKNTNTFNEFVENLLPYWDRVRVLPARFEEVASFVPDDLQFLFLDGEHSYDATSKAWNMYSPKVRRGGVVAFHDAAGGAWPDVERFVAEVRTKQNWFDLGTVGRVTAFQRR
jgi:hypothetical protein